MKYFLGLILFIFVGAGILARPTRSEPNALSGETTPSPAKKKPTTAGSSISAKTAKPNSIPSKAAAEKEEFDKAWMIETPAEKIAALSGFLEKYPATSRKTAVLELITVTRIRLGQEKLRAAETADGISLLKSAVTEMPVPVKDEFFSGTLIKIPTELYFNGQRGDALDIAESIEGKVSDNSKQLLALAGFYLAIESGADAKRLAEKAVTLDPTSSGGYQTLGLASRLNFDLDEAEKAYTKALELEPESVPSLRSLAELKRARGKADEAIELYRRILGKDSANVPAETGLILSLFDGGKRDEAEAELARTIAENPNNVILLGGTAYWYAGHNEPDKAIENARLAIEKDPRYIWSHIALARGLMAKREPAAAEEVLLKARQYGNFPTLEYELASARLMSGFFRDAAEELRKSFVVNNGRISSKLGGRVDREDKGFIELLANERRASIFEPTAADDTETSERLRSLLEFDQILTAAEPAESAAVKAADDFVTGDDKMKLHRELYAASSLLNRRIALAKVLELTNSATGNTDDGFDVADPGAAVMASELYDSRSIALAGNRLIKVPDVPRSTLSAIMRGRIEEIAGWALFYQNNTQEAIIHLRRAVSVMPPKSSWWRSSMWKLGAALQTDGKDTEALDSYIRSYSIDKPDAARYSIVEALYRKVNGNTDGLEAKIGVNPQPPAETTSAAVTGSVAQDGGSAVPKTEVSATPDGIPSKTDGTAVIKSEASSTPETVPVAPTAAGPTPEISSTPIAEVIQPATPTPSPTPIREALSQASPTPTIEATPAMTPDASPTPTVQTSPGPAVETSPTPTPEPNSTLNPQPTPTPGSDPTPSPSPEATPSPSPEMTVTAVVPPRVPTPTDLPAVEPKSSPEPGKEDPAPKKSDDALVATSETKVKPLFDPVIITVPRQQSKKAPDEASEKKENDPVKERPPRASDESSAAGEKRPRVVEGKDVTSAVTPVCSISVSQDAISILNDGGSLGILVQTEGDGDLRSITATSSDPKDVEIKLEPEIAGVKGQAFYVIRSLTTKTGDFKIRFAAPCGAKEVVVTVR